MSAKNIVFIAAIFTVGITTSILAISSESNSTDISRGKYLIEIGGCNDCHTAGYAPSGGTTPEAQWLIGDGLGFSGPWGTTYPINLRKYISELSENEWVNKAKTLKTRPPMPWWALNAMTENDLRAIYKYIEGLGLIENEVPSFVPSGQTPNTLYVKWPDPPE